MKIIVTISKVALGHLLCSVLLITQLFAAESYTAFVGEYAGTAESTINGKKINRILDVSISESGKGFQVDWTTIAQKASGKIKKKSYSIKFIPTHRKNIFSSAMKPNFFGGEMALDPLKGHPYVWARIVDKTLTVYALHVTDDGGYELQIYDRTRTDIGLNLKFTRLRDGKPMRSIQGSLVKK